MRVLLELEGEVVHIVEGHVLEIVDQVVVRHVSELLAQRHVAARVHLSISIQYSVLSIGYHPEVVNGVGEHIHRVPDEVDIGLLGLDSDDVDIMMVMMIQ